MRGLRCYVYCMRYARGTCDPVVVRREEKKSGALLLRRRHGSRPVRYGDLEQEDWQEMGWQVSNILLNSANGDWLLRYS